MATRFRGEGVDRPGKVRSVTYLPNGSLDSDVTYTTGPGVYAASDRRTITDEVTKNYKKLQSSGAIVMKPVTITRREANSTQSQKVISVSGWGTKTMSGDIMAFYAQNGVDPTSYLQKRDEAKSFTLQAAYDKVASEDLMSYVSVVEAGKTASMLAAPFSAARKLIRRTVAARTKLVERGMRVADAASAAWLETRLGWKPVLFDIQNVMEAYVKNTSYFAKPTRLTARSAFKHEYVVPGEFYTANSPFLSGAVVRREKTLKFKVASGVLYELYDENLTAAVVRNMGLRLEDVPRSAWELLTLSFVVDRFITVGAWLNAITPKPGVRILGSWTTTVSESKLLFTLQPFNVNVAGTNVVIPGGDTLSDTSKTIVREVNREPDYLAIPAWNPRSLSINQTIDHAALILASLRGLGLPKR